MYVPKKNIRPVLSDILPAVAKSASHRASSLLSQNQPAVANINWQTLFVSSPPPSPLSPSFFPPPHSSLKLPNLPPPLVPAFFSSVLPPTRRRSLSRSHFFSRPLTLFLSGVALAAILFYGFSLNRFKEKTAAAAGFIIGQFTETADSLSNFDPAAAARSLSAARFEISGVRRDAQTLGLATVSDLLGNFWPRWSGLTSSFSSLETVTNSALAATLSIEEIKKTGLSDFLEGRGGSLLPRLKDLHQNLSVINSESDQFIKSSAGFATIAPAGQYLSFKTDLLGFEDFLGGLIQALDTPVERHWLVAFQNASELRPAGGFLGSYADLSVKDGALTQLSVEDIYDPDGQLEERLIPPTPLQAITTSWGARDANWFFDFALSAEKVIGALERSKIYQERGVSFDGLIAINTNLLKDILTATGPVDLPDYNLTLTSDNILSELQREVEVNRTKDPNHPKTVLKDLIPEVLARLKSLDPAASSRLMSSLRKHIDNKDIMFYSRNRNLQSFFEKYSAAGRLYALPPIFSGDYLAVVSANIAGGKTDAYINQNISLKAEVGLDGTVSNTLTIRRAHNGAAASDPWYRAANQSYLRVLSVPNTKLISVTGATNKIVKTPLNYEAAGFISDNDVAALESGVESGKSAFGAWLTVPAGATRELTFRYDNPNKLFLADGEKFTFVFDRQSGVTTNLDITIESPPGFKWREPNAFTYIFHADDAPKQLISELTLEKI